MDTRTREEIFSIFKDCVVRTLERIQVADTSRPFHSRLLTPESIFWSRFERSFSTSFGQSAIEQISRLVCVGNGATKAILQKPTDVTLTVTQWEEIENITRKSRNSRSGYTANWRNDLDNVVMAGKYGVEDTRRVISDLYWVRDGVENFASIKTVQPNLDQTTEAKRDLLKIAAGDPNRNVYFGLYYNPFGENRSSYSFSPPMRVFDFANDESILIGRDYWETLGGPGAYEEVLDIAAAVGEETKSLIMDNARKFFMSASSGRSDMLGVDINLEFTPTHAPDLD